jgi:hypothetical protein
VYEDALEAEKKQREMQDKANRKMAKEGGMIYYHIKSVPYIGGN